MADTYHADTLRGHLPSLDGWRAVAILLVLMEHASLSLNPLLGALGVDQLQAPLKDIGQLGVQVFFGLSGFLITTKLVEEFIDRGRANLKAFYIRRFFRIVPPAATFLTTILALSIAGQIFVPVSRILAALFFLANYTGARLSWYVGHFWSLAVEEHYYLIWPITFTALYKPKAALGALASAGILIAFWRAIDYKMQFTGSSAAVFWGRTDIQADTIVYGSMAAILVAVYGKTKSTKVLDRRWLFLAAIGMVLSANIPNLNWKVWMACVSVRNIGIAAMITISVLGGMRGGYRYLQAAPLRYIGSISYSLYLWQQLFLIEREPSYGWLSHLQVFPINILLAFGCAIGSKRFIEDPAISLGKRLLKKTPAKRDLVDQRA